MAVGLSIFPTAGFYYSPDTASPPWSRCVGSDGFGGGASVYGSSYGFSFSPDTGYTYRIYRVELLGYAESSSTSGDFFVQNSYDQADYWWLRSPRTSDSGYACRVNSGGDVNGIDYDVNNSYGILFYIHST